MKNLIYYGNLGDFSSFSRVSISFLREFPMEEWKITVLTNSKTDPDKFPGYRIVKMGTDTKSISVDEYLYAWNMNRPEDQSNGVSLEAQIKYSIIQLKDLIEELHPEYVMICNGIYEVKYIMEVLQINKKDLIKDSKLILWTPLDYIPSYNCIKDLFFADYLLTMTPFMTHILKNLKDKNAKESNCIVECLGHGSDFGSNERLEPQSRKKLIKNINSFKSSLWTGKKIEESDIIILNANNCVPRKRLDLTIKIFEELRKSHECNGKSLKLWIHTDIKKFYEFLMNRRDIIMNPSNYILSNNNAPDSFMKLLYQVSDFGLQTSTGEGWSLTNCEHSRFNPKSVQIVPDFLATKFHYANGRGLLLPTENEKSTSEDGHDVIVGIVDVALSVKIINDYLNNPTQMKEFNNYLWSDVYKTFYEILRKDSE